MDLEKIYQKIAKKNGISVDEVKSEMQAAINEAYRNPPNDNGITVAFQKQVPSKGDIPSPDEFIRYASEKIASRHN